MSTTCFTPVLGKRLRATHLSDCGGVPASGTPGSVAITSGFITVKLSSEVEDGIEIVTKKADGSLCVNEMTAASFKRFTMEIEFCGVDPGLLSLITNANPYADWSGNTNGITVPEGTIADRFSLELWTGLSGAACPTGVIEQSGYFLLPFCQAGVLGDIEIGNDKSVSFSLKGAYTRGGNQWGVGPYKSVLNSGTPAFLPTALDPLDHLLLVETGVAPPASLCGLQAMPAA